MRCRNAGRAVAIIAMVSLLQAIFFVHPISQSPRLVKFSRRIAIRLGNPALTLT